MDHRLTLNRAQAVKLAIEQAELAAAQLVEARLTDPRERLELTCALAATNIRNFGRRGLLSTQELEQLAVRGVRGRHVPEADLIIDAVEFELMDDAVLIDAETVPIAAAGSKLDLARAYMDMGDPEGARSILEEVLAEGQATTEQATELVRELEKQQS